MLKKLLGVLQGTLLFQTTKEIAIAVYTSEVEADAAEKALTENGFQFKRQGCRFAIKRQQND